MTKEADTRGRSAVGGENGGDGRLHLRHPTVIVVGIVVQRADVGARVFRRIERGADHCLPLGKRPRIARAARRIGGADEQYQAFATGKGALHHAQMGVMEGLETANENKVVVHGVLAG